MRKIIRSVLIVLFVSASSLHCPIESGKSPQTPRRTSPSSQQRPLLTEQQTQYMTQERTQSPESTIKRAPTQYTFSRPSPMQKITESSQEEEGFIPIQEATSLHELGDLPGRLVDILDNILKFSELYTDALKEFEKDLLQITAQASDKTRDSVILEFLLRKYPDDIDPENNKKIRQLIDAASVLESPKRPMRNAVILYKLPKLKERIQKKPSEESKINISIKEQTQKTLPEKMSEAKTIYELLNLTDENTLINNIQENPTLGKQLNALYSKALEEFHSDLQKVLPDIKNLDPKDSEKAALNALMMSYQWGIGGYDIELDPEKTKKIVALYKVRSILEQNRKTLGSISEWVEENIKTISQK